MRILTITPDLPAPPVSGGRVRTFHLLRDLGRRHEVDVLAPELPEPEAAERSRELCRRLWLYPPLGNDPLSSGYRRARAVLTGRLHPPEAGVRKKLREVLEAERYDVLHFVTPYLFASLPPGAHPPALVDFFGTSIGVRRELRTRTGVVARAKTRWRHHLAVNGERRVLRDAAGVLAISDDDREFLRCLVPEARVEVVPNGVDTDYFAPSATREELYSLAFVGDMGFRPNVDGARFLAREILPRVLAENPGTRCRLVGRNPAPEVLALGECEGLEVTGEVPDVRPYMARATAVVVPLLGGSGVRNKTLEAMAMGRAVVSTSMGVEGLSSVTENEVFIADEPELFARAVVELFDSRQRRAAMGSSARARVIADYDWNASARKLEAFYDELASSPREPSDR